MVLYELLLNLEKRRVFTALLKVGAIPVSVYNDFNIYQSLLEEQKTESRRVQAAFNVSLKHDCSLMAVYRAIRRMNASIGNEAEIALYGV